MGAAGDIRARLRAKFIRRNSAAPSLASTNGTNGDAHSSLTRQSSAAGTASSSQHLHQPHHQPQSQSQPHTPCPGSPEPGADHPLLQRLKAAITLTTAHDKDGHEQPPPQPSPSQQQETDHLHHVHHLGQDESVHAPESSPSLVTEGSADSTDEQRPKDTGDNSGMGAHKPHTNADSAALVLPAPAAAAAAFDRRSASGDFGPTGNDPRPSTNTTVTTAANTINLPSINENQALPAAALSEPDAVDEHKQDQKPSPLPPQSPPPPTVVVKADPALHHNIDRLGPLSNAIGTSTPLAAAVLPTLPSSPRPDGPPRRQSLLPNRQTTLIRTLLDAAQTNHEADPSAVEALLPINGNMVTRKVWVRRPGASPTLITINEDDLVDDVRDMILRKYANSLGRHFDSPDLTLRICPREQRQDRLLGPEEPMGRTLDAYFPGGQTVDEALVIDIPSRRTPRPSPRAPTHATAVYYADEGRPSEAGEGYFPPIAAFKDAFERIGAIGYSTGGTATSNTTCSRSSAGAESGNSSAKNSVASPGKFSAEEDEEEYGSSNSASRHTERRDNPINLKLLEAFVKRLKVRWKTAVNGRDAVSMWRTGGFHLVLMDIQLPIMSGLDATREIRRLERVNSIGVFSSSASSVPELTNGELEEKDRLTNMELFKSPVIIVALTASSLQSDRHEALAAGCNDFLTKPVNFVWLERKVMEWGCMQALIDFDGWRRWKDFSQQNDDTEAAKKSAVLKTKAKKNRLSMTSVPA
ncbi:response regulator receiver domain-containing protein [Colletotrichum asianum]|uniref:Response regulator receiver domain-containing protein n=1 Tax=Colletotrichum asianum TaxID=702518 RepID=A0A8H3VZ35_9PEZI|nr:response regulator receiver domain-containing protein [Colletotrichum asianum]